MSTLTELNTMTGKIRDLFTDVLPHHGYGIREKQIELAEEMAATLHSRQILVSEAAVGIGKTHAYLIAAICNKLYSSSDFWIRSSYELSNTFHSDTQMPIVISTSSIALQEAITRDYIPEISQILLDNKIIRRPLTCVIRKGKEHYVCDRRLSDYYPHADSKSRSTLTALIDPRNTELDLSRRDNISPFVKRKICVTDNCNPQCSHRDSCRYLTFLKDAQSGAYDFQVCNHQYMLADAIRRTTGQKPLMPNYQAVIIDEAHRLEKAAQSLYGVSVSSRDILSLVQLLKGLKLDNRRFMNSLPKYCDKLMELNNKLFTALCHTITKTDTQFAEAERQAVFITSDVKYILRTLRYNIDALRDRLADNPGVSPRYETIYTHLIYALGKVSERLQVFQAPREIVYWLENPKLTRITTNEFVLCGIPKKLGSLLYRDLWDKPHPVILTSGTLSDGKDFKHIEKRLGLSPAAKRRITESIKPSPFDFENNCLLYLSENTPFPDNNSENYIKSISDEIMKLIEATHGHTAVLFTSYNVMDKVSKIIEREKPDYPLFKLKRGGGNAIERFKEAKNGVLFASGSMWEGVNIPGDLLSSLIIVRLPFQVPDPLSDYERTQYASDAEYKRRVILPDMLLKLKQGFGRLIRTMRDTGVVAILDARVRSDGSYRFSVIDALPKCRITDSIAEVRRFIRAVKNKEYFS